MADATRLSDGEPPSRRSEVDVPLALYRRHLGLPADAEWDAEVSALADAARRWYRRHATPWSVRREIPIAEIAGEVIALEGSIRLTSQLLAAGLKDVSAHALAVVAISAGPEVDGEIDRLWKGGRPERAMFLNAYAVAMAEHLRSLEAGRLAKIAEARGLAVLPHYSPGYEGWNLADQERLYEIIVDAGSELPGPLELLPSGALRPAKSTLAAFGITKSSCAIGAGTGDASSDLRHFWIRRGTTSPPTSEEEAAPRHDRPIYAFPEKTLERWANQRLTVTAASDGRERARFRFDGTTCNSMGLPLKLDYEIELGREHGTYRILAGRCAPATTDTGHRSLCGYLTDPERFMESVLEAPSWVGRTLDDLLDWAPETSPTGCLCTRASRDHKWRLVLHTLHYALEHRAITHSPG